MDCQHGRARRNGRQHARPEWCCQTVGLANQDWCLHHGKPAEHVDADASLERSRLLPKGGESGGTPALSCGRLADLSVVKLLTNAETNISQGSAHV